MTSNLAVEDWTSTPRYAWPFAAATPGSLAGNHQEEQAALPTVELPNPWATLSSPPTLVLATIFLLSTTAAQSRTADEASTLYGLSSASIGTAGPVVDVTCVDVTSETSAIEPGRSAPLGPSLFQSAQTPPRSLADTRTRCAVAAHLDFARTSASARLAYERFGLAVDIAIAGETPMLDFLTTSYLSDERAPFRDTLLSYLADHELPLSSPRAIARVTRLLSHQNREIARSAALYLGANAGRSRDALLSALQTLESVRRADLERLLSFAIL